MNKESFCKFRNRIYSYFQNHEYIVLSLFILLTSMLLYWNFVFGDRTLVFFDSVGGDSHHGYIPTYRFIASAIKNGELSSYTFQYGLGNSIFSVINTVSDPISMIGVFVGVLFGEQYIADSMVYLLILKHICSGLLCLYFLKGFNFTKISSMISAYIYAFAGYIMTLGAHYFFAASPVYYIILLILLEKNIKGEYKIRNWIGLVIMVALIVVNSLVTAYEMLLGAGFYTLFRVLYIYKKNAKKIFTRLGVALTFVIAGISISSFILFPVINKVGGSDRLIHNNDYFSLVEFDNIKSSIMKFFSNNLEGTPALWTGGSGNFAYYSNCFPCFFSVMLVPMAAQFVWRTFKDKFNLREKIFRIVPVIIVVFTVVDKFIPYLFSCFVPSSYHSYIYIFLPLYAILFADVFDNIRLGKFSRRVNYITMIASLAIIAWGGVSAYFEGSEITLMWMIYPAVMLLAGCFAIDIVFLSSNGLLASVSKNQIKKAATVAFSVIIALNLFGENIITQYYGRYPISKAQEHSPMLITDVADDLNAVEKDNFFRFESSYYDGIMMQYTYPLLFPIRSTGYYDSALDNSVPEFYQKMFRCFNHNMSDYRVACGLAYNTITEDILGIKYFLSTRDIVKNGWEKNNDYSDRGAILYKNSGLNSAGLFFDSYIGQDEADLMSFNNRIFGLGTRLVLDNPVSNIDDFAAKYSEDSDTIHNIIEISNNNEPIKNRGIDIESLLPYQGVISDASDNMDGYNVKAVFEAEDSNFSFSIDKEIISERNKITQISFKLKENGENLSFVYFDEDEVWKYVSKVEKKTDGNESVYTFIIPQTASHLALCVDRPCELDVNFSTETYDISNELLDINAILPYNGTITSSIFKNNEYTIGAIMDNNGSNFSFSLNKDIINDKNKIIQISFKLKDGNVLNNFAYFDEDGTWKNIPIEVNREIDDYTFVIPQTASHLALCVNQPCELKAAFSVKTYDVTNEAADARSAACYNGTVQKSVIEDNEFRFAAKMDSSDSNFQIYLNTDIVNDRNKSTQISYRLKDSSVVKNFVYYDADNTWKSMPKIEPETDGEESVYKFIIPQTASSLALCVNQPCELDIKVSSETVASTYTNNGIYLDNPKRGNIITGTVEAEKNSLLYLPVPYNEYWDAYIDGEKVEIMKANYAFMAIPVTAGEHHVDLIYSNKIYHTFLKVSITAVILVTAFFITYAVIRRQKQNKEKRENLHDIF